MKLLMEQWRKFVTETVKVELGTSNEYTCPPATQDIELNIGIRMWRPQKNPTVPIV